MYMSYVDIRKVFGRVPQKVKKWAMRKKDLLEVMIRAIAVSLYNSVKTNVRVRSVHSREFEVADGVHQASVSSPLLFFNSCGCY